MNWMELAWPMLASASLIVALAHAVIWIARPGQRVHLALSFAAASVAALALLELASYAARLPAEIATYLRWMHLPVTVMVVSLLYILHRWFGLGSVRIAYGAAALRLLALAVNFLVGDNLNFLAVTDVGRSVWFGVPVSHPIGVTNPAVALGQLSNVLVLVYIGQTILHAVRQPRPDRRAALIVAGSWFVLMGIMVASAVLMVFGLPRPPLVAASGFLLVVVTTSYCLVSELIRSQRMVMELQESELRRLRSEQEVATERACLAHMSRVTTLGELSGSLVHELNQPLAAILSNAQAAQRLLRRDAVDVPEIQEIVADIIDNDRRASEVIGRMRGFLRKETYAHAPVAVNEIVSDCVRMMRSELHDQRVTLELDLAEDVPACMGDRVQLQQVLVNLIMNGCDAMQSSTAAAVLGIRTRPWQGGARVEVTDAGSGIPEGRQEQIFSPFETTKASGLGMGLAVCRTIIRAHGGTIEAENVPPKGARVSFNLPPQG